jgi:hypothetical protein
MKEVPLGSCGIEHSSVNCSRLGRRVDFPWTNAEQKATSRDSSAQLAEAKRIAGEARQSLAEVKARLEEAEAEYLLVLVWLRRLNQHEVDTHLEIPPLAVAAHGTRI